MPKQQHEPYRSRDEIRTILLSAIKEYEPRGGIYRTRLMMLANITNVQLKQYLQELLLDNELITVNKSKGRQVAPSPTDYRQAKGSRRGDTYHLTERGEEYLKMIQEMQQKMGIKI